jgi:predicted NBD/HSP70 family sugar kinase
MMIVLALGRFGPPASRVLTHVRRAGVITREDLAKRTGLSASTVARTLSTLVDAELLRERPDHVTDRAVGRPSLPVEIDTRHHVTVGAAVGRRTTTVSLADLRGRVLLRSSFPTPVTDVAGLASAVNVSLTGLLAQVPERAVVGAGLVAPWGDITYNEEPMGNALSEALGMPVKTGELIPAIAAAEYLARDEDLPGSTLYLYARNTVGFVMANQRESGMEIARVGRLGHFPYGGITQCRCGRTGCLESVVSDESVAVGAMASGIVSTPHIDLVHRAAVRGDDAAHRLLCARATALGRVAAIVRDMVHPDRVVLCGQALTAYPPALDVTREAFNSSTATPEPIDISFTRFVGDVQSVAAGTAALRQVYDDPTPVIAAAQLDRCSTC